MGHGSTLLLLVATGLGPMRCLCINTSPWLPDLLTFQNNTPVVTPADWAVRKVEVLRLAQETFLGTFPAAPPALLGRAVVNRTAAGRGVECVFVTCSFDTSAGGGNVTRVDFPIEIIQPTGGTSSPVFMTQWNHRQWAVAGVPRGYVGVVYPASDARDVAPQFQAAYPAASFALIAARAWVASRALDCLYGLHGSAGVATTARDDDDATRAGWPGANLEQVAVSGHSRNGKQSLIFAAIDTRVAAVVGSSPGAPIAAPYRFTSSNYYGEGPRTGAATCVGPKWWLCSSLQYDGHPERMPMDGHGVLGSIAPRFAAIATGHQDQASDMIFAGEMNIRAAGKVYALLGAEPRLRNIYRYGQHHGFDDITTYFDWFDRAFDRQSGYEQALRNGGGRNPGRTADGLLEWYQTWLTPAGFDWRLWNATAVFDRVPPPPTAALADRVRWVLAIGTSAGGGELGAFSMGATYSEESEASAYIPGMMGHAPGAGQRVGQQAFSFGDYLSAQAYWATGTPVGPAALQPAVIWLHPFSYNTGYTPSYMGARAWSEIAAAGYVVMAYDQIGFGIRNTQGGNRFYGRHGGNASLLGHMVKDARAAVDFMLCRSRLRSNATACSQHGYSVSNAGVDRIPYVDPARIYLAGYSLGGMVALHAAALDPRVAGVAAFAAFTPFRTDTADKPTGGLRRLSELHALLPRLGAFVESPKQVPYDYDELIASIAPRPTLLYTPQGDREASFPDVAACVAKAAEAWPANSKTRLDSQAPDGVTKFEAKETAAAITWLDGLKPARINPQSRVE